MIAGPFAALAVGLVMSLGAAGPAAGQAGSAMAVSVDASAYPTVTATLTTPPALGGRDLTGALTVMENGRPLPVEVTRLRADELDVALVIDTSGSMSGAPMAAAKAAASSFLGRLAPSTRVAVIGFGPTPVVASPFTLDRKASSVAVAGLEARGETALYDALVIAVDQFSPGAARRTVIVLSDGGDTVSRAALAAAAAKLSSSGVRVEAIELASKDTNTAALTALASAGGGRVTAAADPASLAGIFDALAALLSEQYRLTFRSEASGVSELAFAVNAGGTAIESRTSIAYPAALAPAPVARPAAAARPRELDSLLAGGAGVVFLAITVGAGAALWPSVREQRRARLARLGRVHLERPSTIAVVSRLADRATVVADTALERGGRRLSVNTALERAGVTLRPGEFLVLVASATATGLLVGLLLSGLGFALLLAAAAPGGAWMTLKVKAERRRARFAGQLGEILQLQAGSLRAGYGLVQAFDAVAREAEAPSSDEFHRLVVETRLGRDLGQALDAVADRMASIDFTWVVGAIEIHRQVGGDLAEVLDNVAATIREREQIRRQVKALSAEGRISAYVLVALPFLVALAMRATNPTYLNELGHGSGLRLLGLGVVLMVVGMLWLKRVCRLVY